MVSRGIGTPAYASPELWKHGAQIDGRADIYSPGVMLFEMLAGRLPFSARSVEEMIQVKLNAAPLPLAGLLPGAPAALDDLLRRMMAVDPALRPRAVGEVPALFDAARQTHSDLLRARIVAPPPREDPARKQSPAPRPPQVERPVERGPEIVRMPPSPSQATVRFRSPKRRVGIGASVLAVTALLGYVSWRQLVSKPSNLFTEDLGNGVKIEMIKLPGGEFTMGSNEYDDEKPPHQVKLSPFAIGKYEVTQRQWKVVMGNNPSQFNWSDDLPVENVSWEMARDFIKRLNARVSGGTWRLPTEAEWEYAARAGSRSRYSFGDDASQLHNYAWFYDSSDYGMQAKQTHPVGHLRPNGFGLYDIQGNVWEWCSDWYDAGYYKQSTGTDPQGPSAGSYRVHRGGGWGNGAVDCRSADRGWNASGNRSDDLGFRLVRDGP